MGNRVTKFVFIVDSQEAFVRFERDRVLKQWGVPLETAHMVGSLGEAGAPSLFGPAPCALLELEDKDQVKAATEVFRTATPEQQRRWAEAGVIVMTTVARTSTRSLEKFVTTLGGEVVLSKEGKDKGQSSPVAILQAMNLSREVKDFLKDYAGENYGLLIPLLTTFQELTPKQQATIALEDVLLRLPLPPGAIPPWSLEDSLLEGNIPEVIKTYRRIALNIHVLATLRYLKNKFTLAYRTAVLTEAGVRDLPGLAQTLGEPNNYPLKKAAELGRRKGSKVLGPMVEHIGETERKIKGGSSVNSQSLMEILLVNLALSLRRSK